MKLEDITRIESIAVERPENLFWVSTAILIDYVRDEDNPPDVRAKVVAELVVRWCLSGNDVIGDVLKELLPDWQKLSDWYLVDETFVVDRALPSVPGQWRDPSGLPGCESCVRMALDRLFRVDGFIPVFVPGREESGRFIPFALEATSGEREIVWSDGSSCPEWSAEAAEALLPGYRCRLQVCTERDVPPPEGASLMLPLRMACWRKANATDFPRYDVLRVVATGKIEDGRLASVRTCEKFRALGNAFRKGWMLIGPDVPGEIPLDEHSYLRLDVGTDMETVRNDIRRLLENAGLVDHRGVARITWRYALGRLPDLRDDVDRLNRERWTAVADRLGVLKERVRGYSEEGFLDFLSLYAVALCHAGRTDESIAANREAYDFARCLGKTGRALRLQIERMVNDQDSGLEEFPTLMADVENRLAEYTGTDADDLRMRYHGTVAQAAMCGSLLGLSAYSAESARKHAEKAVALAKRIAALLPVDAPAADLDAAESNVQQDMNYLHLWYAIFAAGTEAERTAFRMAEDHLEELGEKSMANNRRFLLRQTSLALFNAWRREDTVPSEAAIDATRVPLQDTEGWLVAANRAHLGVLYAVADQGEKAIAALTEGECALPLVSCHAPVLGAIRFVLLVRAVCTLRGIGRTDEALRFADLGRETYGKFKDSRLFQLLDAATWKRQMEDGSPVRELPAFYY